MTSAVRSPKVYVIIVISDKDTTFKPFGQDFKPIIHKIEEKKKRRKSNVVLSHDRNKKSEMRSFKSNENIHKKEGGSYYVVSANKASSVTL